MDLEIQVLKHLNAELSRVISSDGLTRHGNTLSLMSRCTFDF